MTEFKITLDARAIQDIQDAINYYNQQPGLGEYFFELSQQFIFYIRGEPVLSNSI